MSERGGVPRAQAGERMPDERFAQLSENIESGRYSELVIEARRARAEVETLQSVGLVAKETLDALARILLRVGKRQTYSSEDLISVAREMRSNEAEALKAINVVRVLQKAHENAATVWTRFDKNDAPAESRLQALKDEHYAVSESLRALPPESSFCDECKNDGGHPPWCSKSSKNRSAENACRCHAIIDIDPTRHFKECPKCADFPKTATEPCTTCDGSGRVVRSNEEPNYCDECKQDGVRSKGHPSWCSKSKSWADRLADHAVKPLPAVPAIGDRVCITQNCGRRSFCGAIGEVVSVTNAVPGSPFAVQFDDGSVAGFAVFELRVEPSEHRSPKTPVSAALCRDCGGRGGHYTACPHFRSSADAPPDMVARMVKPPLAPVPRGPASLTPEPFALPAYEETGRGSHDDDMLHAARSLKAIEAELNAQRREIAELKATVATSKLEIERRKG